jgi:hypothetical protein
MIGTLHRTTTKTPNVGTLGSHTLQKEWCRVADYVDCAAQFVF